MKGAAVMFDYRRFALWIAVLLVPGGILLLPLLLADIRRQKNARKVAIKVLGDGPGSRPRTPDDGTLPRLAA